MRTGDVVFHGPSGEEWLVAWADHESGYIAPCGWPTCEAKIADCTLVQEASGDKLVDELARSGRTDAHKATSIRSLAGKAGEA